MSNSDLEPIEPVTAREMYLAERSDISDATRSSHAKRLRRFTDWCDEQDITNLNTLSGRDVRRYRIDDFSEKEDGGEYSDETVRCYLDTLRVFLRFVASIEGVDPEVPEKVKSPRPKNSRDVELEGERAERLLENLATYEYASLRHVLLTLLVRVGARVGTLHAVDVGDVDTEKQQLHLTHSPDRGTPLKNQWDGERSVALADETIEIIEEYIEHNRPNTTDEHGRWPLFVSEHGRRHISNLRELVYTVTRPCEWGVCPHDRDPAECDAASRTEYASKCPSTVSPHPVRRGAITHMLRSGVPKAVVSDRADVSAEVLDEHYDTLSEEEKAERRRDYLDDSFDTDY